MTPSSQPVIPVQTVVPEPLITDRNPKPFEFHRPQKKKVETPVETKHPLFPETHNDQPNSLPKSSNYSIPIQEEALPVIAATQQVLETPKEISVEEALVAVNTSEPHVSKKKKPKTRRIATIEEWTGSVKS